MRMLYVREKCLSAAFGTLETSPVFFATAFVSWWFLHSFGMSNPERLPGRIGKFLLIYPRTTPLYLQLLFCKLEG
jgi:hypothetical protein